MKHMTDLINDIANSPLIQALNDAGLTALLFGAVAAIFGYLGQLISNFISLKQREKNEKVNRLLDLYSMLRVSRVVYLSQREELDELLERIAQRLGKSSSSELSLEEQIEQVYPLLNDSESRDFKRIRGMTQYSMYSLNRNLQSWVKSDVIFRTNENKKGVWRALASGLNQLESHLSLWKSKYMSAFKGQEDKAVVYLRGQHEDSIQFPAGLNRTVLDVLRTLGVKHLPNIL